MDAPNHKQLSGPADIELSEAVRWYCERWLRLSNRSPKTITAYLNDLRQFTAHMGHRSSVQATQRMHIENWVLEMQSLNLEATTIRRKLASLRGFFRFLVDQEVLERTPLEHLRVSLGSVAKLTRVVSGTQVEDLLDLLQSKIAAAPNHSTELALTHRNHTIVRLLSATGIRVGELCQLDCGDVDTDLSRLRILGKGNRERLALLVSERDKACINQYLEHRFRLKPIDVSLFLNARGSRMTTEGVRSMLRSMSKSAKLETHITPHMLRHTAATRLMENGADIRVVQAYLGHKSIRSTERYTHVSTAHLSRILKQCHPLRGAA